MFKSIKEFFTTKHHRDRVNVNHPGYLDKNLKRKYKSAVDLYRGTNENTLAEVYIYKKETKTN